MLTLIANANLVPMAVHAGCAWLASGGQVRVEGNDRVEVADTIRRRLGAGVRLSVEYLGAALVLAAQPA